MLGPGGEEGQRSGSGGTDTHHPPGAGACVHIITPEPLSIPVDRLSPSHLQVRRLRPRAQGAQDAKQRCPDWPPGLRDPITL